MFFMMTSNRKISNFKAYSFHCIKNNFKLFIRSFSATPVKKSDPVGAAVIATSVSLDPITISFIILVGMANILYIATCSFYSMYLQGTIPEYTFDNLRHLYEIYYTFSTFERETIEYASSNLDMFSTENLRRLYGLLRIILNERIRIYSLVEYWISVTRSENVRSDLTDFLTDFRSEEENLVTLLRQIEDVLNNLED